MLKVISMGYEDLTDWVKNKAKPGELAYHEVLGDDIFCTYHYTKPDLFPRWRIWFSQNELSEYLENLNNLEGSNMNEYYFDDSAPKIYVPKKVAEIKICNALRITIDETINFVMPTEEQRKNLKEMLCIEVVPINE